MRRQHPEWGGWKIRKVLQRKAEANKAPFDEAKVPAASTCSRILHRQDLIREEDAEKSATFERFEKERPNQLWQMDFKGDFLLDDEARCYPLTVVDDHSRFAVVLGGLPKPAARDGERLLDQGIPALRSSGADHHRSRSSPGSRNGARGRWALLHRT